MQFTPAAPAPASEAPAKGKGKGKKGKKGSAQDWEDPPEPAEAPPSTSAAALADVPEEVRDLEVAESSLDPPAEDAAAAEPGALAGQPAQRTALSCSSFCAALTGQRCH